MKKTTQKVWLEIQKKDNKGKPYITGVYFGDMPPQNVMFTYKIGRRKPKVAWLFDKHYIPAELIYEAQR